VQCAAKGQLVLSHAQVARDADTGCTIDQPTSQTDNCQAADTDLNPEPQQQADPHKEANSGRTVHAE
jgi:hypothetical protein